MTRRQIALALAIGSVSLLAGCGTSGPETVRVAGTVTYDGSTCPGGGTIYFQPVEAAHSGLPQRPATADFNADGSFRATSFHAGDGLVPGTYNVRVECWLERTQGFDRPGKMWGPGSYQFPTPLVVESGQRNVDFDVDLPAGPI